MMFRTFVSLSALSLLAACGSSSTTTDGGASDSGGKGVLGFRPSNIDLSAFDLSAIGDVDLSGTNCVIDSEQPDGLIPILCDKDFTNKVAHKIITLSDQTKLSVFVMRSLRIEASTVLSISRGHFPVVLVATQTMDFFGSIDVAPGTTGGPVNSSLGKGAGSGGGTAGDSTGLAGGGGSYCGLGGKAGTNTAQMATAPGAPTPAYGAAELVPLLPGSAGGSGVQTNDLGSGGGALQLVAGTSIALRTGATINVGGGGGGFGGFGKDGAGGGGSGGALLVESLAVTIDGKIGANGGGGGQGMGDSGEQGHPDQVALGGHKMSVGAPAGNGSFGATMNGSDGPSSADLAIGAGSGGGGAGRIRINTQSGAATLTGAISPAAGTCFTQAKVTM